MPSHSFPGKAHLISQIINVAHKKQKLSIHCIYFIISLLYLLLIYFNHIIFGGVHGVMSQKILVPLLSLSIIYIA